MTDFIRNLALPELLSFQTVNLDQGRRIANYFLQENRHEVLFGNNLSFRDLDTHFIYKCKNMKNESIFLWKASKGTSI